MRIEMALSCDIVSSCPCHSPNLRISIHKYFSNFQFNPILWPEFSRFGTSWIFLWCDFWVEFGQGQLLSVKSSDYHAIWSTIQRQVIETTAGRYLIHEHFQTYDCRDKKDQFFYSFYVQLQCYVLIPYNLLLFFFSLLIEPPGNGNWSFLIPKV